MSKEEFTKRARLQLDEGTLPVTELYSADNGKYYIPNDIVDYYHEACDRIDRLEAELKAKGDIDTHEMITRIEAQDTIIKLIEEYAVTNFDEDLLRAIRQIKTDPKGFEKKIY
jgi:hypothetical protein